MATMKTRAVAFNLDKPEQRELYEWTLHLDNYSDYVKKLLRQEMERRRRAVISVGQAKRSR